MITLEEAAEALDWEPQAFAAPEPSDWRAWGDGRPCEFKYDPNTVVLVRENNVLGRVSNKYTPFWNRQTFDLLVQAVDRGWYVDSIKEFNGGRTVVANLVAEGLMSEGHEAVLALVNSFTGRGSLKLLPVHRRIFCANQLPFYGGAKSFSIAHSGEVGFPAETFGKLRTVLTDADTWMNGLKEIKVDFEGFMRRIIDETMENPSERIVELRKRQLERAYTHETAPEPGTAYAALQAVALADQKVIGRGDWRKEFGSEMSQAAMAMLGGTGLAPRSVLN